MNTSTDRPTTGRTPRGTGATGSPTGTMRAIVQHAYGPPETLPTAETDIPSTAADEVLAEGAAAGLDRGVWPLVTGKPYLVRLALSRWLGPTLCSTEA